MRFGITLAAMTALAALIGSNSASSASSRYESLLATPEGRDKLSSLAAMEHSARLDEAKFRKLASDKNALVRLRCAEVLARVGEPYFTEFLADLAFDEDPRVAETAIFALGLIRDVRATDPLARCLASCEEAFKIRSLEALGRIGAKNSPSLIAPYLRHFKSELRSAAASALASTGDSACASEFDAIVHDSDTRVAASVAYAYGRLGYSAGIENLCSLLSSPDARTRLRAVEALGRLKAARAVPFITRLLEDSDRLVVLKSAEALERISSPSAADALAALLPSDDAYIRTASLRALAKTASSRHRAAIEPFLHDKSSMVRRAALGAVTKAAAEQARPCLLEALEKGSPLERCTALELLGEIGNKTDLPLICSKLLSGGDILEAEGAAYALGKWKQTNELKQNCGLRDSSGRDLTALDVLLAAANGNDWAVASIAIESLAGIGGEEIIAPLMTIYRKRRNRLDADRRLAIVETSRSIVDRMDKSARTRCGAFLLFEEALLDPDPRVRTAAIEAAKRFSLGFEAQSSAPLPIEKYPWGEPSLPLGQKKILISTSRGEIELVLYGDDAPNAVKSIIYLAGRGFYDGLAFHRVVPGFVIQGGCPRGDGWGDAGYFLRNEVNLFHFKRGTVGLADSGKDTAGSQFFITQADYPHLDGRYTVIGRVVRGMDVVDRIEEGDAFSVKVLE